MSYILCSYTPICTSLAGRAAAAHYGIPPFADASCRREPDFEHDYHSISSTCRGDKLVNRLQTGDVVVYITKKGRYPGMSAPCWRLTAALEVIQVCDNHRQGAVWYRQRGLRLPYNCIYRRPLPEAQTARIYRRNAWPYCLNYPSTVAHYAARIAQWPRFIITEWRYRDLNNPPLITGAMMKQVFNKIPITQNQPYITDTEYRDLLNICGVRQRRIPKAQPASGQDDNDKDK